ncbi:MAG TPA: universal stress protein, partial [Flavobacteriales bacterium]|nr:universal stress protein [Flavobacteriales bacterium]
MPSLLIPTDLSDASRNAAIHGLRLFGSDATSVTLLHTYVDPALSDPFLVGLTLTPGLDNAASDALRAFKEEVGGSLGGSVPRFNSRVLLGSLPGVVKALHQEEHYDLVVMPLLGEGGGYGSLFGSEVADVIKSVRVPVLAVPPQ